MSSHTDRVKEVMYSLNTLKLSGISKQTCESQNQYISSEESWTFLFQTWQWMTKDRKFDLKHAFQRSKNWETVTVRINIHELVLVTSVVSFALSKDVNLALAAASRYAIQNFFWDIRRMNLTKWPQFCYACLVSFNDKFESQTMTVMTQFNISKRPSA